MDKAQIELDRRIADYKLQKEVDCLNRLRTVEKRYKEEVKFIESEIKRISEIDTLPTDEYTCCNAVGMPRTLQF